MVDLPYRTWPYLPAFPARNVAEQILQLGFVKKHIHNFLADIVSRESHKIGEGTMVLKAAAVNMLADAEVRGGEAKYAA